MMLSLVSLALGYPATGTCEGEFVHSYPARDDVIPYDAPLHVSGYPSTTCDGGGAPLRFELRDTDGLVAEADLEGPPPATRDASFPPVFPIDVELEPEQLYSLSVFDGVRELAVVPFTTSAESYEPATSPPPPTIYLELEPPDDGGWVQAYVTVEAARWTWVGTRPEGASQDPYMSLVVDAAYDQAYRFPPDTEEACVEVLTYTLDGVALDPVVRCAETPQGRGCQTVGTTHSVLGWLGRRR